ncbi:MAG: hypothetical protein R3F49_13380 [Planctomycetota bacterium]
MIRRTLAVLAILVVCAVGLGSCRTVHPNRDPLGETLPTVSGQSLEKVPFSLPGEVAGAPAVLVLGFVQDAQFDADRWLLGLLQAQLPVRILEVPTARGLVPSLIRGTIDGGMRSGIPSEDWGIVWTVYGEGADALQRFTGNERPRNVRVLLLDGTGQVRWFHDRGYSAGKLLELAGALKELAAVTPE